MNSSPFPFPLFLYLSLSPTHTQPQYTSTGIPLYSWWSSLCIFTRHILTMKYSLYLFAISALYPLSQGDVGDFSPCVNSFYRDCPPSGIEGTPICQNFKNKYHFATLYSRERRSPWFSAYLYTTPAGKRPRGYWKYEPQVSLFGRFWTIWIKTVKQRYN